MRQAYDYWQDQPGSYSSVAAARQERRGADLGPTQGRERVLTLKRLGTGAQSEASVDGLSHRTGPLSIIRHQRRWSEPSDGLAPCYPDPHPTHPPQGTDALPSLSNLNVLLVPGTVRNSAPAAAGPRRPIRQQAPSAKVNGTFERSLAAGGRATKAHQAAAASRTRIDSPRASISCNDTRPSIRGGTPSRGPHGTFKSGT